MRGTCFFFRIKPWSNNCKIADSTKELLRAADSKYQKSLVSRDILDLLIFCLSDPFGELFLKITLESSADF